MFWYTNFLNLSNSVCSHSLNEWKRVTQPSIQGCIYFSNSNILINIHWPTRHVSMKTVLTATCPSSAAYMVNKAVLLAQMCCVWSRKV
jgi:hypothetical protein